MKTVMLFGTFDILHAGHLHVFKKAREHGDIVIAVLARDVRVEHIKGRTPVHNEAERKELLEHVDLIDTVVLGDQHDVYKVIAEHKPNVILLGYDQHHFTDALQEKLKEFNLNDTDIIRLEPYKAHTHKSGKIKEYMLSQI